MDLRLEDFANTVLNSTDAATAWTVTTRFFDGFGFEGSVYGQRRLGVTPKADDIRFSARIQGWQAAYLAHKDYERDPLFIYAPQMPSIFFTGASFLDDYPYLGPEDVAVIHRARSFGLQSGIALKMTGGVTGIARGWNLVSALGRADIQALHEQHGGLLHICAALADQKIAAVEPPGEARLTERERECLVWLAQGLRTDQIADRMSIRPVTVDMHMRNARTRLGARTREQALAIAIRANLLPL